MSFFCIEKATEKLSNVNSTIDHSSGRRVREEFRRDDSSTEIEGNVYGSQNRSSSRRQSKQPIYHVDSDGDAGNHSFSQSEEEDDFGDNSNWDRDSDSSPQRGNKSNPNKNSHRNRVRNKIEVEIMITGEAEIETDILIREVYMGEDRMNIPSPTLLRTLP